jgi:5-methyltetrahydropteroyltriglutamate--homocysteine methyltransferase
MIDHLLPTTVIGSYPQPDWLIDRKLLAKTVPRVRMQELWRIPEEHLAEAQDDATRVAIAELEEIGVDVITDGEIRRESYSNHFLGALDGIDFERPAVIVDHRGQETVVPRVAGDLARLEPVELDGLAFLRRHANRPVKVTLPGPFTLAQQAYDDHYGDIERLTHAFAGVVNEEARALAAAGADVVQLDEPWLRNDPVAAKRFAVAAIDRALEGVDCATVVHLCFGYAALVPGEKPSGYTFLAELSDSVADQVSIEAAQPNLDLGILADLANKTVILGVLDLREDVLDTPDSVASHLRQALAYLPPERLVAAPDCGMKYLSRSAARVKLEALVAGARLVSGELG